MRSKRDDRNRPTHQHWVPQFYLRHFATRDSRNADRPQVWIFSKEECGGDEKLTNVRNVCGKRYLYSPTQLNGERNWGLDEKLDELESLFGEIWVELAEGFVSLSDENLRKGIALFVAVMHLRNPEVRKEVERIHQQLVMLYESWTHLQKDTPEIVSVDVGGRVCEFNLSSWDAYRNWERDDHDRFFVHIVQSEAESIAKLLLKKRWSVVFSEVDTFITADRPVAIQHQSREKYGFGTDGTIVTFPLSPTRLLVMDDMHDQPANQYYPLQEPNAGAFNFSVWRGAARFMITGRSVADVLAEICLIADQLHES